MNMNPRWQGLALFLGGILMGIGLLIHPNEAADPNAVITGRWILAHGLLFLGAIPALLGLVSVYERLKGLLGFIAYLLTFSSIASFIFAFALETFVVPVMAADPNAGMLLDPSGPLLGGPLGVFFLVIGLAFTLGAILLGIAILRSSDLPKWSGILWIVAAPVSLVPPLPYPVLLISGLALGLAFAVTGFAIWSRQMPMTRPATT
ncbi:MAG: hypothetical protein QN131_12215 [Armatimonadota bacterium]|nr:hypothetical protein [Armatimonadota bacterium]